MRMAVNILGKFQILVAALAMVSFAGAEGVSVDVPAVSSYADTESVTNVVFFADGTNYPPSQYEHNDNNGAHKVGRVGEHNETCGNDGYDCVGVQLGVPPISAGSYTLSIPQYWGVDEFSCTNFIVRLDQVVEVDGMGNTTIHKGSLHHTRNAFDEN